MRALGVWLGAMTTADAHEGVASRTLGDPPFSELALTQVLHVNDR